MSKTRELRIKLAILQTEHRDLDDAINRMVTSPPYDQLRLQRLKKKKLTLKDQIAKIENQLVPDIIA